MLHLLGNKTKVVCDNKRHHPVISSAHIPYYQSPCESINLRMRRNPHIIRPKPPIKPEQPLLLGHLPKAIKHAFVRHCPIRSSCLLLQPRLHEVKRQRQKTGEEAATADAVRVWLRLDKLVFFSCALASLKKAS